MDTDREALLARLKVGAPAPASANPTVLAVEPDDGTEAALWWVQQRPLKRGPMRSPPARVLAEAARRWGEARGWARTPTQQQVGWALAQCGFRKGAPGSGYWVAREAAAALWLLARELGVVPYVRPSRRPGQRRPEYVPLPKVKRKVRTGKARAVPLVSCDGRRWASAGEAARALGCRPRSVQQAVRTGRCAGGLHFRRAEATGPGGGSPGGGEPGGR